jgi:hypothetical protein
VTYRWKEKFFRIFFLHTSYVTYCVCPLSRSRRQVNNPFPPIPAAADQALLRWPPRWSDLMPCNFVSYGYMLITLSFYSMNHRICMSCADESSLPCQKSTVTCCSGHGQTWLTSLASPVSQWVDTRRTYSKHYKDYDQSVNILMTSTNIKSVLQILF